MKKPPQIKSFRYQDVFAELRSVLIAAMSEREARSALVDAEPEWVEFERSMMTLAVDRIRAAQGLAPADPALTLRAERLALGHSDYAAQYAHNCADVALEKVRAHG